MDIVFRYTTKWFDFRNYCMGLDMSKIPEGTTWIEIEITTQNKAGHRYFNRMYYIEANRVGGFPEKHFSTGWKAHLIPMSALSHIHPFNQAQPLQQSTKPPITTMSKAMFLSAEEAASIMKDTRERKEQYGFKPYLTPGVYAMKIASVVGHTDDRGYHQVHVSFQDTDEKYNAILDRLSVTAENPEHVKISRRILADRFFTAFGHTMQGASTFEDLIKQFQPFVGKELNVAIYGEEGLLYQKNPDGTPTGKISKIVWPRVKYTGPANMDLHFSLAKAIRPLKAVDEQAWMVYCQQQGLDPTNGQAVSQQEPEATEVVAKPAQPARSAQAQAQVEKAVAKAAAKTAPVEESEDVAPEVEPTEDMPWQ